MDHLLATPQRLADLVEYQADSIVSQVVFRGPGGTMTVFAFAEGQGLSEHSSPYDGVVHVLAGETAVRIDGVTHRVREGEMLHLPPEVPHALVEGAEFKLLLIMLKPSASEES